MSKSKWKLGDNMWYFEVGSPYDILVARDTASAVNSLGGQVARLVDKDREIAGISKGSRASSMTTAALLVP